MSDLASVWVLDSSGWLRRLPLLLEKSPVYFRSTVEAVAIVAKASAFYFISVMRSTTVYTTPIGLENLRNYISNLWRAEDLTMRYFTPAAETLCVIYNIYFRLDGNIRKKNNILFIWRWPEKYIWDSLKIKILEAID